MAATLAPREGEMAPTLTTERLDHDVETPPAPPGAVSYTHLTLPTN